MAKCEFSCPHAQYSKGYCPATSCGIKEEGDALDFCRQVRKEGLTITGKNPLYVEFAAQNPDSYSTPTFSGRVAKKPGIKDLDDRDSAYFEFLK